MASSGELPGADLAGSIYPSADVAGSFLEVTEWPGHDAAELFEDADRTIAALRNQVEVLAALAGRLCPCPMPRRRPRPPRAPRPPPRVGITPRLLRLGGCRS